MLAVHVLTLDGQSRPHKRACWLQDDGFRSEADEPTSEAHSTFTQSFGVGLLKRLPCHRRRMLLPQKSKAMSRGHVCAAGLEAD